MNILKNIVNGVSRVARKVGNFVKAGAAAAAVAVGGLIATTQPAKAAIDLTDVTDQVTALETAVLAVVAIVITAGIGLAAVKFGGKWLMRVFKSFTS